MEDAIVVGTGSLIGKWVFAGAAVAVAAFVVWLTVRIINRRERWAKRTAIILGVVLILYPLSSGPAMWILVKTGKPNWLRTPVRWLYKPLDVVVDHGPDWMNTAYFIWDIKWTELATGKEVELEWVDEPPE